MPYFDRKRKKWRGEVKKDKKKYASPKLYKTKTEAKLWETEKREALKSPELENIQTGMDLLTACNMYLDFSKLKHSKKTYDEKKKLCEDILKKWDNIDVENVTSSLVIKHLKDRAVGLPIATKSSLDHFGELLPSRRGVIQVVRKITIRQQVERDVIG